MSAVLSRTLLYFNSYPLLRGVATYAVIWPVSNLCQQAIAGKEKFDFIEALRYSLYGALYVAPSLHGWLKLSGAMWPQMNVKTALRKALVEQFSYAPFAVVSFFFGMSLLEGKSSSESANEVRTKFWPTLQVGVCVWPVIQTVNFAVVPEQYRVIFVGFCSLIWTCFLAYMKQLQTVRTDGNMKQVVALRNFSNAPKRSKGMPEVTTSVITAMRRRILDYK